MSRQKATQEMKESSWTSIADNDYLALGSKSVSQRFQEGSQQGNTPICWK
jgi:hypothetical protein